MFPKDARTGRLLSISRPRRAILYKISGSHVTIGDVSIIVLLAILFAIAVVVSLVCRKLVGSPPQPDATSPQAPKFRKRQFLLSKAELSFCQVLKSGLPDPFSIQSKVRLADVLEPFSNQTSQKHLDFVIVNTATSEIVAAVELDDSSHRQPAVSKRDDQVNQWCKEAGLPLHRIPAKQGYSISDIAPITQGLRN